MLALIAVALCCLHCSSASLDIAPVTTQAAPSAAGTVAMATSTGPSARSGSRDAGSAPAAALPVPAGQAGSSAAAEPDAGHAAPPDPRDAGLELDARDDTAPEQSPVTDHPFFATVELDEGTTQPQIGNGDLWPNCWSDDDALYTAAGDGTGFGVLPQFDVVTARIDGRLGEASGLRGTNLATSDAVSDIWSGREYNRKPTGMLCRSRELYLAVQDLRIDTFDEAPAATIVRSTDKGKTWTWNHDAPMFSNYVFTTIMFLDYGQDSQLAPDDFVYAYGLDDNWAFNTTTRAPPTKLYLARVPHTAVQDRARWEFFAGLDEKMQPRWVSDIAARQPVLEDARRLYARPLDPKIEFKNMTPLSQGGVVYNAPLARYIYSSWTEYTFELYEAPAPWGPFTLFYSKDFGVFPFSDIKNGGYGTTIPSKLISADGRSMWIQANSWLRTGKDNYSWSLRELRVTPWQSGKAQNTRDSTNLAARAQGAVALTRALRTGLPGRLNDGATDVAEDSWNGDTKTEDYWGYTWSQQLRVNELRYTTGAQSADGGFFEQLGVQVRKGRDWVDVASLSVTPPYAAGPTVPAFTTFTLKFEAVETDGVRVYGRPGGTAHYTSLAELGVYYE